MTNKIKFSHKYPKLWGQKTAELVCIKILEAEEIGADLKHYDT